MRVADMADAMRTTAAPMQEQSNRRRSIAHDGAEIGGSERQLALAGEIPIHAAGTGNAVHLSAEFTL